MLAKFKSICNILIKVEAKITEKINGKIQSKTLDFMVAMGDNLVTVDGDMNVMMGMQTIFEKMEAAAAAKK